MSQSDIILSTMPLIFLVLAIALFAYGAVAEGTSETRQRLFSAGLSLCALYAVIQIVLKLPR
jgi:hypothetical protein